MKPKVYDRATFQTLGASSFNGAGAVAEGDKAKAARPTEAATRNWQRHSVKGTGAICIDSLLVVMAKTLPMYHTPTSSARGTAVAATAPPFKAGVVSCGHAAETFRSGVMFALLSRSGSSTLVMSLSPPRTFMASTFDDRERRFGIKADALVAFP